jgi:hypothetical protein
MDRVVAGFRLAAGVIGAGYLFWKDPALALAVMATADLVLWLEKNS